MRVIIVVGLALFIGAVLLGRSNPEPQSREAASVEFRIRWLEAKVLELQAKLDKLEQ